MSGPTAAPAYWPYRHRTVEQIDRSSQSLRMQRFVELDAISRERELTPFESRKLERLTKLVTA